MCIRDRRKVVVSYSSFTPPSKIHLKGMPSHRGGAVRIVPTVIIKNGGTHNGDTYIAVSDHLNYNQYKAVLRNGKEYNSLEEAYKAYVTALADSKYNGVRDS